MGKVREFTMIEPKKVFQFRKAPLKETSPESGHSGVNTSLLLEIPADLGYFEGHFPGNPVFPAVAIIDATTEAIRTIQHVDSVYITTILSAKFMDLIRPSDVVLIEVSNVGSRWTAQWIKSEKRVAEVILQIE